MSKLGKRLILAMTEAVAIARGEADPSTCRVHYPDGTGGEALKLIEQRRKKKIARKSRKPAAKKPRLDKNHTKSIRR